MKKMTTHRLTLFLLFLAATFTFSSCKKKCTVGEDTNSGAIVQDVVIYSDANTASMGGNYLVSYSSNTQMQSAFEVRFGYGNRQAVDFNNFSILAYPINSSCRASYDRTVTIDDVNDVVTYKIVVTECEDCSYDVNTQNFVMVPSFPASYQVVYDISYVKK